MTIRTAWSLVLRTHEGQIVLADILRRAYHFSVTNEPDQRVLQQFAIQTLQMAGDFAPEGSFPVGYIQGLTGIKLYRPSVWDKIGRVFGRKSHV